MHEFSEDERVEIVGGGGGGDRNHGLPLTTQPMR